MNEAILAKQIYTLHIIVGGNYDRTRRCNDVAGIFIKNVNLLIEALIQSGVLYKQHIMQKLFNNVLV